LFSGTIGDKVMQMVKKNNNVLAEGEVTGHFHRANGNGVAVLESEDKSRMVLQAPNGAIIEHEEHKPIEIPQGEYDRFIVKEYKHEEEEIRDVVD